ncbi:MAG: dockerin type I repeat-containing protein [Prevotella sp.]|nr:dockerin type I repeat-containing protein [Prevotella sp.]
MKRFLLLTSVFVLTSMVGFAQKPLKVVKSEKKHSAPVELRLKGVVKPQNDGKKVKMERKNYEFSNIDKTATRINGNYRKAPQRKSQADGFVYTIENAPIFTGIDLDGYIELSYTGTDIIVPPYAITEFTNQSGVDVTWQDSQNQVLESNWTDGNYAAIYSPDGGYYPYIMSAGDKTFQYLEDGFYILNYNRKPIITCDSLRWHTFVPYYGIYESGSLYSSGAPYNGLVDDNGSPWVYGTGTVTFQDEEGNPEVYTSYGVEQTFPAPGSPLYIDQAYVAIVTDNENPIANGAEVKMLFRDLATDEVIATMTATADDLTGKEDYTQYWGDDTSTGKAYVYNLVFSNKETSATGGESIEPVVITDSFSVSIIGLDDPNLHFGIQAKMIPTYCTVEAPTALMVEGENIGGWTYYGDYAVDVSFHSMFDYFEPVAETTEYKDINMLNVSADGKTVENASGATDNNGTVIDYGFAYAARPFYDSEGIDNYFANVEYSDDSEDWFTLYMEDDTEDYGTIYFSVDCEALPSGVSGRYAKVYFEGLGYTSSTPIIIKQGEIDVPSDLIRGDINGDGVVNTGDVTILYNVIFGTDTTTDQSVGDLNNDGNVNTGDVTVLYNIIFGTAE